ncbi:MAG: VUT family protein [Rubrivivax sp.]
MSLVFAIAVYTIAMTLANLSVAAFGPSVTAINAFVLIGLDLALRDWLHVRLKVWQMGALIAFTGALTFVLNPAAGQIAVASAVAFTAAALVDWGTFLKLKGTWLIRANGSNVAGAAVDSLIFPTIAFGALMPQIVLAQFVAKVAGGALWAWLLARFMSGAVQERRT